MPPISLLCTCRMASRSLLVTRFVVLRFLCRRQIVIETRGSFTFVILLFDESLLLVAGLERYRKRYNLVTDHMRPRFDAA